MLGNRDVLFFLHIPKSAGVTLIEVVDQNFGDGETLQSQDWRDAGSVIEGMSPLDLALVRCVRGHHWFGPGDEAIHDRISIDPITITVLRDPVARTVSVYQHVMRWKEHWLREYLDLSGDETMPLLEFVEHPEAQGEILNLQARLILGNVPGNPKQPAARLKGVVSFREEELLERAMARLDTFGWIGLTERMNESVALLTRIMGWNPIDEVPVRNRNVVPSTEVELSAETRQAIFDRTQVDRALYARAVERFEASLKELFPADAGKPVGAG